MCKRSVTSQSSVLWSVVVATMGRERSPGVGVSCLFCLLANGEHTRRSGRPGPGLSGVRQDATVAGKGSASCKEAHLGTQVRCPVEMHMDRGQEEWAEFELAG